MEKLVTQAERARLRRSKVRHWNDTKADPYKQLELGSIVVEVYIQQTGRGGGGGGGVNYLTRDCLDLVRGTSDLKTVMIHWIKLVREH